MTRSTASIPPSPRDQSHAEAEPWTLVGGCLLAASCVGRLLTPTESAASGGTLAFALISMLALAILTAGSIYCGRTASHWRPIDALVATLCGAPPLSLSFNLSQQGDVRAGLSLSSEWLGLWAVWCCLRHLQASPTWVPRLQRLIASLVVSLALLGIWQNVVGYRQARDEYRSLKIRLVTAQQTLSGATNPVARLRAREEVRELESIYLGLGIPLDPAGQMLWESRLEHSQEPVGLFALANTFAAVLLCGLTFWLWPRSATETEAAWGATPRLVATFRAGWYRWLVVVPVAFCLLLTKCRSAWLASLVMVLLAAWVVRRPGTAVDARPGGPPLPRRWLLAGVALLGPLVFASAAVGQLDRLVVLESFKSLRYRVEYWRGTWNMLTDQTHPSRWLTGVGPGQFRTHYLPFKLPESSEEIADPHNALFDHWASGGLTGLLAVLGLWGWSLWLVTNRPRQTPGAPSRSLWPEVFALSMAVGALAMLTTDSSLQVQLLTVGLVALACLPIARAWKPYGLPEAGAGILLLGLLIHLLFAGGIALPAVVQLLLLCALPARSNLPAQAAIEGRPERLGLNGGGLSALVGPLAALAAAFAITQWALLPVLRRDLHLARGDESLERGQLPAAEREFRRAIEADRWSLLPRERLATVAELRWQGAINPALDDPAFLESVRRRREAIELQPLVANGWRSLGELWERAHTRSQNDPESARKAAREAVAAFTQASRRHPTQADIQAHLADMQFASGERESAAGTARRILELEAINQRLGHVDKQLPTDTLNRMRRLAELPPAS